MSPQAAEDPRRWRRRAITVPLTFLAATIVLCLASLLLLVALIDALRGSRFAWTRALACVGWLVLCESAGLVGAGALHHLLHAEALHVGVGAQLVHR